jgi:epoxyqueuosine reductase
MDLPGIKQRLKTEAACLGFSLFGVTTPDPPNHIDVFKDWLGNSFHGEMTYLSRRDTLQKRSDPRLLLPSCRSILCFGYPYHLEPIGQTDAFKIASYARMEDYHRLFARVLARLVELVQEYSGGNAQCHIFSDSAPIMEREMASRAGLGWIGKNSCLISPSSGSAFLLAEVFTTLELEPDPPFTSDRCGSCTRCLEACPTSCILPNRTIDARRCLSYLTIEYTGGIPLEYRESVGNWVFGCDVCQQVCPWNSKLPVVAKENDPSKLLLDLRTVHEIFGISELEFKTRYTTSPFLRVGLTGMRRDLLISMGNSGDPTYLSLLEKISVTESDPVLHDHAVWAIRKISSEKSNRWNL